MPQPILTLPPLFPAWDGYSISYYSVGRPTRNGLTNLLILKILKHSKNGMDTLSFEINKCAIH